MTETKIGRRTLAKGAAWAAPAAAVSMGAPAYADSKIEASICRVYFGNTGASSGDFKFFPTVETSSPTIPKGSKFSWTISGDKTFGVPDFERASDNSFKWTVGSITSSGSGSSVTVTLDILDNLPPAKFSCPSGSDLTGYVSWPNGGTMAPGTTLTISMSYSSQGPISTNTLKLVTPRRNNTYMTPTRFLSKSQACYPQIWYGTADGMTKNVCGTASGNSTSTVYPVKGCVNDTSGNPTVHMPAVCE